MKKGLKVFLIIVDVIILGVMIFPNIRSCSFWKTNIYQVISVQLTLGICFYLAQHFIDRRRKIDFYERKLLYLQKKFDDGDFISNDKYKTEQEIKKISNLITHLKEHSAKNNKEDFKYIEEQFTSARELYDNHINKQDGIEGVKEDISLHLNHASSKIDNILLDLYDS